MTGRQDQNGTDEKGLFGDFSVSTVIASGLAAATSFALSSKIGLAGSIIGVAIGGVASAAASQIYKSLLKASAQKLSDLTPDATANAAPEEAAAAVDAEPAADETRVYRPGSLSGRSPIQEVAASGTPIAPASVRYAAHERERRMLRRRATAIAAAFAIAAVLLFALVVNLATQGAGIGSGGKVVCIMYHNTLRMIFRPGILVTAIASVNPHLLCSSFLSTSILDRRISGIFTPISPAFSRIETASFKINPMQTASRR